VVRESVRRFLAFGAVRFAAGCHARLAGEDGAGTREAHPGGATVLQWFYALTVPPFHWI